MLQFLEEVEIYENQPKTAFKEFASNVFTLMHCFVCRLHAETSATFYCVAYVGDV